MRPLPLPKLDHKKLNRRKQREQSPMVEFPIGESEMLGLINGYQKRPSFNLCLLRFLLFKIIVLSDQRRGRETCAERADNCSTMGNIVKQRLLRAVRRMGGSAGILLPFLVANVACRPLTLSSKRL